MAGKGILSENEKRILLAYHMMGEYLSADYTDFRRLWLCKKTYKFLLFFEYRRPFLQESRDPFPGCFRTGDFSESLVTDF